MPNHTTNIMYVSGDRPELERFKMKVSSNNPEIIEHRKKTLEFSIGLLQNRLAADPKAPFISQDLSSHLSELEKLNKGEIKISSLDFYGTVPMPVSLNITSPAHTDEEKTIAKDNIKKCGHPDWCSYHNANYGTKWNAYDVEDVEDLQDTLIYRYQTAWSPPIEWIIKTSELFPTLTFKISAADEGGYYYLANTYKAGEAIETLDMSEHDWRMEYDSSYAETYNALFSQGYKKGIQYALDMGEINYSMEEQLLKFIKDDDLPLFINFKWENNEVSEDFNERLKFLDKEGVEKKRKAKKKAIANA